MNSAISRYSIGRLLRFSLLGISAMFCGCGRAAQGPEFAPAKGIVRYQGKPLEFGQISFVPDRSKGTTGPMAIARISSTGEFELQTLKPHDGALVGSHQVAITCYKESTLNPNNPAPPLKEISLIPVKYADHKTSNLTAEVSPVAKQNVYTFELQ